MHRTFHGPGHAVDLFMARQPIFSKDLDVFAHELLFRKCEGDVCALITDFDDATNQVIADGFALATKGLGPREKISVNVGYDNILSGYVLALPPERTILEVPSDIQADDRFFKACDELKEKGYCFLLDNFTPTCKARENGMVPLADFIKVPVDSSTGREVARLKKELGAWRGGLVASRIESWEAFEGCRFLGFNYFQGYFFSHPKEIAGKKLPSLKAARLRLLKVLSDEEASLGAVVDALSTDQALSVRLLQFVNSAAFCMLDGKIDSLARAASLAGLDAIRKWATAAVLSDLDPSGRGRELSLRTLNGAFFLSRLTDAGLTPGTAGDTLFLLGLLRNVDGLMDMKMKDILADMPLDESLKKALLREPREPLARYVALLDRIDANDWDHARGLFKALGIAPRQAANAYLKAGEDTHALMSQI
ncbi:hypothetical protein NNJEOMEG_01062 [Fundidesulfovibrio magnetotacticus]|uniref:HDOD domain-containing protein n=1 Tax=Fundidesulfovibrio magnetotacticus TaxID=2730080 RepID=A0A6V8LRQ2_9BACT|nr:HDOD domain-containing protein [Fundidesulfovibrio magnetotacticus]GFK93231.1 hypothetical protein NNJEOMEG_01062 [Fundidesulfovibrio magnetotacticus]